MGNAWDRHLRLAVTGLARSSKTAFVTALIQQLEQAGFSKNYRIGRFAAGAFAGGLSRWCKRIITSRPLVIRRHYRCWRPIHRNGPEPTHPSEIRLELRFSQSAVIATKSAMMFVVSI